jgi:hypothetical protein
MRIVLRLFALLPLLTLPLWSAQGAAAETRSLASLQHEIDQIRTLPLTELGIKTRIFMKGLSREEIELIRPVILDAPFSASSDTIVGLFLEYWSRHDGPAALSYATKSTSVWRTSLETVALAGWAHSAPRAAWDRLMVISNRGADRRYDESAVLAVIAAQDLTLALELFEDLTSDRTCLMCNAPILAVNAMHQGKLPLLTAAIARMHTGPTRNALRDAYWELIGQRSPQAGLAEAAEITNSDDRRAAELNLAKGWADRDFAPALDHVLAHYSGDTRDEILLAIIQVWTKGAVSEDVAAVTKKLPSNLSERSLLGIVPIVARVDPRAATTWAVSLPSSAVRTKCIGDAIWTWARIDAEPAHEFFRNEKDTETAGILLWSYLLGRVSNNTLQLSDLEDVADRFNLDWRVRLLSEISLRLANPAINHGGAFDLAAYRSWVEKQPYSEEQRSKILQPIRKS